MSEIPSITKPFFIDLGYNFHKNQHLQVDITFLAEAQLYAKYQNLAKSVIPTLFQNRPGRENNDFSDST